MIDQMGRGENLEGGGHKAAGKPKSGFFAGITQGLRDRRIKQAEDAVRVPVDSESLDSLSLWLHQSKGLKLGLTEDARLAEERKVATLEAANELNKKAIEEANKLLRPLLEGKGTLAAELEVAEQELAAIEKERAEEERKLLALKEHLTGMSAGKDHLVKHLESRTSQRFLKEFDSVLGKFKPRIDKANAEIERIVGKLAIWNKVNEPLIDELSVAANPPKVFPPSKMEEIRLKSLGNGGRRGGNG